jgi:hypothetical protein
MPETVLPLLNGIEATVLVEHMTVRILYHRAEVIGLATSTLPVVADTYTALLNYKFSTWYERADKQYTY